MWIEWKAEQWRLCSEITQQCTLLPNWVAAPQGAVGCHTAPVILLQRPGRLAAGGEPGEQAFTDSISFQATCSLQILTYKPRSLKDMTLITL